MQGWCRAEMRLASGGVCHEVDATTSATSKTIGVGRLTDDWLTRSDRVTRCVPIYPDTRIAHEEFCDLVVVGNPVSVHPYIRTS